MLKLMGITAALLLGLSCSTDDDPASRDSAVADSSGGSQDSAVVDSGLRDGQPDSPSGPVCTAQYRGCTSFEDRTGAAASRRIEFTNFTYTPACMEIKAGQTVTFAGNFDNHPLRQACGPEDLFTEGSGNTPQEFVMNRPGLYGYYCFFHGQTVTESDGTINGQAMAGAIRVVP